jgi:zinc protease
MFPRLHRTVLENGLTILVLENPVADIVSARIVHPSGQSPGSTRGCRVGEFLNGAMLTKGTQTLSSLEIAEAVESVGASLGTDAAADYSVISLKTVSADFGPILRLAASLLRYPSFPDPEIDLEQRLTLQQIRSMQEQPFTVAFNQLRQDMYGDHPYSLPGIGTETTVATGSIVSSCSISIGNIFGPIIWLSPSWVVLPQKRLLPRSKKFWEIGQRLHRS